MTLRADNQANKMRGQGHYSILFWPLHDTFDRNCFFFYFISHCYTINSNYFQSIYNTNEQIRTKVLRG